MLGASVTFTGAALGCASPEYQFQRWDETAWSVARAWSSTATWLWSTTGLSDGWSYIAVEARAGTSGGRDTIRSLPYHSCRARVAGLTPNVASPRAAGTSVTWTATSTGSECTSPRYQFYTLAPGGTWTQQQAFSAAATFVWGTTGLAAGAWTVGVHMRQDASGSPVADEAAYTLTAAAAPTVVQVVAGTNHSCARMSDGTARCWGLNSSGQLGDNTTTQRTAPVAVVGEGGTGTLSLPSGARGGLAAPNAVPPARLPSGPALPPGAPLVSPPPAPAPPPNR